jgi:hypothetical protein
MTFPILGGNGTAVSAGPYNIDNSLRFNDDDSAYLTRTNSAGNRKTWTWSSWVKRCDIPTSGSQQFIFTSNNTSNYSSMFFDESTNRFNFYNYSGGYVDRLETNAVYRDVSAWYHFFIKHDSTQSTEADRLELYVNGVKVTSFATANYPTLNYDSYMNVSGYNNIIGRQQVGDSALFDGYLADVYLIDGTAKAPTDFGEFDDSGIWKPKAYSGSYGTNGFKLDFSDSGSLGADASGLGNNFTATNLASTDQMPDTPTKNFNTLSPLAGQMRQNGHMGVLSQGNLQFTPSSSTGWSGSSSNFLIPQGSGKWYAETVITYVSNQSGLFGIQNAHDIRTHGYFTAEQYSVVWQDSGDTYIATVSSGTETNKDTSIDTSVGDIYQIAYDSDNGKIWFGRNNTWITGNPSTDTSPAYSSITGDKIIYSASYRSSSSYTAQLVNFGQDSSFAGNKTAQNNSDANGEGDFFYAPPTGFLCLNTTNLATELSPTIDDGSQYFNTTLVTSTGSDITINTGFKPDFLWTKSRSYDARHELHNTTSGDNKRLVSNLTTAEETFSNYMEFTSNGATFKTNLPHALAGGGAGRTGVAWSWSANGGTTSSNTDGSITSTVQANTTAGFSIVTYTGTGASATVGHGLGVVPSAIIGRSRTNTGFNWGTWHKSLQSQYGDNAWIKINSSDAYTTQYDVFNPENNTTSVIGLGSEATMNNSGSNYVAYCFAEIEGYSKMGSYTGNGNADGTFVYTGFRPAWVLRKCSTAAEQWHIQDTKRLDFNNDSNSAILIPSTNAPEATNTNLLMDILSNGFKCRASDGAGNGSGRTYIYMAFAENPFLTSSGVPVVAR